MIDKANRTVADLICSMEQIAPQRLAEPWDKVGLQLGDKTARLTAVLLTLDVSWPALELARAQGCNMIVCHHPLIFTPLTSLLQQDPGQELIRELIRADMNVYAAHTNLDAAAGGVADSLADQLAQAFAARITLEGCLTPFGRKLQFTQPILLSQLIRQAKTSLAAAGCLPNTDQDRLIRRLAVFPGSFSEEFIPLVQKSGIDCVICGEAKHSTGIMLDLAGLALLQMGHAVTEQVVLKPLARRLADQLPALPIAIYEGLVYNKLAF